MISNIIKLLDDYPLEWEFSPRKYDSGSYYVLLEHQKTKITIRLHYGYSFSKSPDRVSLDHHGNPYLGWWEHHRLYRAVERIQRRRYDAAAEKYIKTHRPRCHTCKKKLQCPKCDKQHEAVGAPVK